MDRVDERANKRFGTLQVSVTGISEKLDNARVDIQSNAAKIDLQAVLIAESKRTIAGITHEVNKLKAGSPPGPPFYATASAGQAGMDRQSAADDEDYDHARRSLRLRPIGGSMREDLWRNACFFLQSHLCLNNIVERDVSSISRPKISSGRAAKDEIIIKFANIATWDTVVRASAKLAGSIDRDGRPTAGIRIKVPRRLRMAFSILFRYGQQLTGRHGEGTRKHVKFDNTTRSLYLNVKLPGDERWSRVSLEVARRGVKARKLLSNEELEQRLEAPGLQGSRPRSVSVSGPTAMDTLAASGSGAWTGRASVNTE